MARIEVAPEATDDLNRIVDHLTQHDAARIEDRIAALMHAVDVLSHSPLIGRPVRHDLRELIIGRAADGYVILYRYIPEIDTAFVLAVRSQRGFRAMSSRLKDATANHVARVGSTRCHSSLMGLQISHGGRVAAPTIDQSKQ